MGTGGAVREFQLNFEKALHVRRMIFPCLLASLPGLHTVELSTYWFSQGEATHLDFSALPRGLHKLSLQNYPLSGFYKWATNSLRASLPDLESLHLHAPSRDYTPTPEAFWSALPEKLRFFESSTIFVPYSCLHLLPRTLESIKARITAENSDAKAEEELETDFEKQTPLPTSHAPPYLNNLMVSRNNSNYLKIVREMSAELIGLQSIEIRGKFPASLWRLLPIGLTSLSAHLSKLTEETASMLPRTLTTLTIYEEDPQEGNESFYALPDSLTALIRPNGFLSNPGKRFLPQLRVLISKLEISEKISEALPQLRKLQKCRLLSGDLMQYLPRSLQYLDLTQLELEAVPQLPPQLKYLTWAFPSCFLTHDSLAQFPKTLTFIEAPSSTFPTFEGLQSLPLRELYLTESAPSDAYVFNGKELLHLPLTLEILILALDVALQEFDECFGWLKTPRLARLTIHTSESHESTFSISPECLKSSLPTTLTTLVLSGLGSWSDLHMKNLPAQLRTLSIRCSSSETTVSSPSKSSSLTSKSLRSDCVSDASVPFWPGVLTQCFLPAAPLLTKSSLSHLPEYLYQLTTGEKRPKWWSR